MTHTYHLTGYDEGSNVIVELEVSADQAVEILAEALKQRPTQPAAQEDEPKETSAPRAAKKKTKPRASKVLPESSPDAERITKLKASGMSIRDIAVELGMSYGGVYARLKKLGSSATHSGAVGKKKASKSDKRSLCDECGTTGSRHYKTCSRNGSRAETIPSFGATEPVVQPSEPMTQEQYDALRTAMHDREFSTLMYAQRTRIRPREINAAIKSADYQDYLANR